MAAWSTFSRCGCCWSRAPPPSPRFGRSEDDIAAIRACAERAEAEIGKPELMPALDAELHERIVLASGNPLLVHLHAATSALGAESRSYTTRLPGVLDDTIAEHGEIVAAIAAGDDEGARLAMETHLRRVRDIALAHAAHAEGSRAVGTGA